MRRFGLMFLIVLISIRPSAMAAANFAQFPAESAFRTPAPNVIVSVDNARSMDTQDVPTAEAGRITRLQALRQLLQTLFTPDALPDDAIRLAYQSTQGCNQLPAEGRIIPTTCTRNQQTNRMAPLRGAASLAEASTRGAFWRWLDELKTGDGLPATALLDNAGAHLMQTDAENPWSDSPGTPQAASTLKTCRRAYHLFLTDGAFAKQNPSSLPAPAAITRLPDGTVFEPASNPQLQVYQDKSATAATMTSPSALALHYWAQDLQPTLTNRISPIYTQPGDEVHTADSRSLVLCPYWNPQNDPATWQHMVNFTVDLGSGSAKAGAPPLFSALDGNFGGADYDRLLLGSLAWPDPSSSTEAMRQDLWHTALNSRGRHFQIGGSLTALQQAMSTILARIAPNGGQTISGYASNGGSAMYVSSYEATHWSGQIVSNLLAAGSGTGDVPPNPNWGQPPRNSTADKLDALTSIDQRVILTHDGDRGVPFRWDALAKPQQTQLQSHGASMSYGPDLVRFLRGDRTLESVGTATGFRARASRLGDIVHSRMWHVAKPASGHTDNSYRRFAAQQAARAPMLYVGGNDGMLHGFSAKTGDERIAYVPRGVHANLHLLAAHDYRHHYYVDGSPFTADALVGTEWKTLLVGSMGAGGPGFFVLDVTTPDKFAESGAAALVVLDRTDDADADIGHVFAAPTVDQANSQRSLQVTRLNNGRWALVLGNGYGSANGQPVLLIQYLDGAQELLKIAAKSSANGATPISNGLSAPQFLDVNSDGIPDVVYAGDLQGRLWKFDIAAASDQRWKVAFDGSPLFAAVRNGKMQPITTAPLLRVNTDTGGLLVAFGTGQELSETDSGDDSVQSVYSVMDYTRYRLQDSGADKGKAAVDASRSELPNPAASCAELMAQGVQSEALTGTAAASRTYWALQGAPFAYCLRMPCAVNEKKGWYLDLPADRERVLDPLSFYGGGNVLEIISRVPATTTSSETASGAPVEACEQDPRPGLTYRTLLHIATGAAQKARILDTNGDGQVSSEDAPASRATAARHELRLTAKGGAQTRQGSDGKTDRLEALPTRVLRPSWRQLK
ncbi:hypothetical protein G7047_24145 [Diaphorobacter sp. HDW4A]|uniref:pilus assembly protein n=1 Tax=Diaphorobacter sp. HDW4A TaxID=2714924 RepID=UPI00140B8BE7|nr:PilC/PilY family type IV pilus protein [Diaphorobacter sp. HDW4A]QIL82681.1 hypothetical protein G7047_24145 [Diaphorobacter sp. HDW4A]